MRKHEKIKMGESFGWLKGWRWLNGMEVTQGGGDNLREGRWPKGMEMAQDDEDARE